MFKAGIVCYSANVSTTQVLLMSAYAKKDVHVPGSERMCMYWKGRVGTS